MDTTTFSCNDGSDFSAAGQQAKPANAAKQQSNRGKQGNPVAAFLDAMIVAGLDWDGPIIADNGLQRFKSNGDKTRNGWYVLHTDGVPAGQFGCYKRQIDQKWCAVASETLTAEQRADRDRRWQQQRAERDADRQRQQQQSSNKANEILSAAQPATDDHPYLAKKAVKAAPGVKVGNWLGKPNCLLIPLRTADGTLATLQAISPDSVFPHSGQSKDFLKGGKKQGAYFALGDLAASPVILIAEGYATAATLHEATGYAAVMACDAGNLKAVATVIKALYPRSQIVLCADNDRFTEGNPGVTAATAAAKQVKGKLAIPAFLDDEAGSDWNDWAALHGMDAVKVAIQAVLEGDGKASNSAGHGGPATGPTADDDDGNIPEWAVGLGDGPVPLAKFSGEKAPALVFNDSLLKHNKTAEILFETEFKKRLFYDPVMLQWLEYRPDRGVFEPRPQLAIEKAVYRAIGKWENTGGKGFDAAYVSGVTKCLLYESVRPAEPVKGKICFTNGVLDLATRELLPHSPDHHFITSLPFDWTPDAPEPTLVIDWLMEVLEGHADRVQLIRAFMHSVVVGRPDLQKFLELVGYGGTGKGTLIRLITALVGSEAVHNTELRHLENNRFESANIFGKKLVVISDAEKYHGDVSMLKSITGQDAVRFEQKHKQGGDNFTYGGMVIISANQHTESTDYSSGIQRRRITVPFNVVCPIEKKRDLEAEFEPLLPAVLKWVLDMPEREVTAYLRSTSAHAASLRNSRLEALAATNPMVAWMLDNVTFDENLESQIGVKNRLTVNEGRDLDGTTTTHVEYEKSNVWLYPNYCLWCDQNGKKPVSKNQFSTVVIDAARNMLAKSYVRYERRESGRYVVGMALHAAPCQPMTTYDNRLTTQTIDSAEDDNLSTILEVTTFLNDNSESESTAPRESHVGKRVNSQPRRIVGKKVTKVVMVVIFSRINKIGCHRVVIGRH